jgi:hypothetical protein
MPEVLSELVRLPPDAIDDHPTEGDAEYGCEMEGVLQVYARMTCGSRLSAPARG